MAQERIEVYCWWVYHSSKTQLPTDTHPRCIPSRNILSRVPSPSRAILMICLDRKQWGRGIEKHLGLPSCPVNDMDGSVTKVTQHDAACQIKHLSWRHLSEWSKDLPPLRKRRMRSPWQILAEDAGRGALTNWSSSARTEPRAEAPIAASFSKALGWPDSVTPQGRRR